MIREKVGHISDDIVVPGSRAKGTAKPTSDIDIAIRVPAEKFDELIQSSFSKVKPPNPGSAKETIDGQPLKGKQILEIPASNKNFSGIQDYVDLAKNKYGIEIRFREE
ncbi:nucleotidyltransferase domain-containing protein [Paenibacillus lautus]|uniref:nucleotidyltransferase domain-containing protein n=1 Tax=Paenibacillus lautus TaxID=1401 RepID=UPI003D266C02